MERLVIEDSNLVYNANLKEIEPNLLLLRRVTINDTIYDGTEPTPLNSQFSSHIENCKFKTLILINSTVSKLIKITESKIEALDIRENTFYKFIDFDKNTLCSVAFSTVELKKSLNYQVAIKQVKKEKWKKFKHLIHSIFINRTQFSLINTKNEGLMNRLKKSVVYRRYSVFFKKTKAPFLVLLKPDTRLDNFFFREYIKINKMHLYFKEINEKITEAEVFFFLRYCYEKSGKLGVVEKVISILYRWISSYGESINRSFMSLLICVGFFTIIYYLELTVLNKYFKLGIELWPRQKIG